MPLPCCSECRHWAWPGDSYENDDAMTVQPGRCLKGHRPRFIPPRSPMDSEYGWKRTCADRDPLGPDEPNPTFEKP